MRYRRSEKPFFLKERLLVAIATAAILCVVAQPSLAAPVISVEPSYNMTFGDNKFCNGLD
ncbi:MAG: hypothetical protein WAV32_06425 [Halobacteriota archaeon]